jgi:hypothetical protein
MNPVVVRDEVFTTRVVVTVGPVDRTPLGEGFGWFMRVRNRGRDYTYRERDRRKYGTCVICRRPFRDEDQIHMAFNVVRNGEVVGNRLCCASCAATHGTLSTTRCEAVSE